MTPHLINAKYTDRILLPGSAIPKGSKDMLPVKTADGTVCLAHFLSTWDNGGGRYEAELDRLCQRQWGCGFELIRSLWRGRLISVDEIWHYIELKKIEK